MISNPELVFCCIHDMMVINQNQHHFWTYITLVVWDVHLDQSIRSAADMNVIQRNPTDGRNFMTNVIKRVVIHQYREIGNHLEIWEQFWDKCWCHKPLCSKIEEKTKICIRPLLGGILGQGQGQDKAAQGFLFPNDFKAALFVFRWIWKKHNLCLSGQHPPTPNIKQGKAWWVDKERYLLLVDLNKYISSIFQCPCK